MLQSVRAEVFGLCVVVLSVFVFLGVVSVLKGSVLV